MYYPPYNPYISHTENLKYTQNINIPMAMPKSRKEVSKRNIVLKIETYNRLERFLLEVMKVKGSPRVTFDEAVNFLLDEYEKRGEE